MPALMLLGNCVAQRLAARLADILPRAGTPWQVVETPPIHSLYGDTAALADLARRACACERVFSQPLFGFGPCNTEVLRPALGGRLLLFSAPNFEAYFPDVLRVSCVDAREVFPPPLEWHSRIFVQCYAAGIDEAEVPAIYLNHALFRPAAVSKAVEHSCAVYRKREQDVELGTWDYVQRAYAQEPLFHTWNHPSLPLMEVMLDKMLDVLGLTAEQRQRALLESRNVDWGFGFNAWPVITRHHRLFHFTGPEYFRVGGQVVSLEDMTTGYYNYYRFHPKTLAAALAACMA